MHVINEQFGRILLVLAGVWTALTVSMNQAEPLAAVPQTALSRPVRVELDKDALAVASAETYFAPGPGSQYAAGERFVFVPEKKVVEFVPVELDIPPAGVMRPPQVLPEVGPSLDGAHKLPRFGDEMPPVVATPAPKAPAKGP